MSLVSLVLSAGFGGLIVFGIPFAFAIGLVMIAGLYLADIDLIVLPQTFIAGTQSFSLLAIPFFMLAGELMSAGGLSERLVKVAEVLVRHLRGGLGHVTVLAALIFAAISGSAPATTAAIGVVMVPAMASRGYSKAFAVALVVCAGVLAPLVPPSIAFVIWGVISEQSIARLFAAGIIPGLLMAAGMMCICWLHARKQNIPVQSRASFTEVISAFREGFWALLAPVIVLGGIYGGIFTPTEASVVSCVYALFVGAVIERRLTWKTIPDIVWRATRVTALIMVIIAFSTGFGVLVAQEQLATRLASWLSQNIHERWQMLLALNVAFMLLASVMDEIAIMVVLGPLLIEIANSFQINPIHFGTIIVTNVAIGMAAPPVGYCLFIGMAISGLKLGQVARAIWPFILAMLVVLMVITYVPAVTLTF
ncbi:C4-dicarboxylate transport system [Pusillimonas sp. T7-7]|uniref:TRAP transporter large permease n=1 Tax=Pusillimonas sp. (strain T7-7) TaxID=1007105 RepID=UPI0002084F74|nr:TRAP transporter large permease [Pusillimonas sp. T7-7]AEC21789.1 C4-dicarboxylate transport system [Pusillimonas sp. T7-7]